MLAPVTIGALAPLEPPEHRHRERDEDRERERRRKERRPIVQHAEIREDPPDQEEREPEHRSREDAESDAALPPLEVGKGQRHDHHDEHGRGIEHLVPECDLEARRLLRIAAEEPHVFPQRVELELFRGDLVDRQQRRTQDGVPQVTVDVRHRGAGQARFRCCARL